MRHQVLRLCAVVVLLSSEAGLAFAQQPPAPAPPQADFSFRTDGSRWVQVAITGTGSQAEVVWPEAPLREWDTALLSIGIAAGVTGTPYIEMVSGNTSQRQYFRAEESGPRWLNLSYLKGAIAAGSRVTLRADGLTMGTGTTTLRFFAVNPDLSESILVLAPHPDDAEIGAFNLYSHKRSTVATVTVGNAGSNTYAAAFDGDDVATQYQFKGRIRFIDSITIPWQGGVPPERAINLGYFDARLATMHETPASVVPEMYGPNTDIGFYLPLNVSDLLPKKSRQSSWNNLVDDIETLLRKVNPKIIAAPHPQLDNHRDHQFTTVALVEALSRWRRDVTLLLYTNHADNNRYPYGPAGTTISLPAIAQTVELDKVFSLPVSPDEQRDKLFALESMHDLRYTPMQQYQMAAGEGRTVVPEKEGGRPDITYLRRGPRANELFFVYDQDTVKPMIETFLALWRARPRN